MNHYNFVQLEHDQRTLNRTSAERWDLFASHRAHVTDLIVEQLCGGADRVCILGAGNCNDVDLVRLATAAREVDLVDVDAEALERGVTRQLPAHSSRIRRRAGIDITGLSTASPGVAHERTATDPDTLIRLAQTPARLPLAGNYDVVVSSTLLTQLINSALAQIGNDDPRVDALILAVRAGHMRTMLDLVRPGGSALLITEIVSNRELPGLPDAAENDLPALTLRAIAQQKIYAATNPAAIVSWLMANRPADAYLKRPGIVGPWRWWLSRSICYLVVGVLLKRP